MSEHSPGPWRAGEPDGLGRVLVTCQFGSVADVIAGPNTARLIAAAPELYEYLKQAQCYCPGGEALCAWCERRAAFIARIEGTPPP